VSRRRPLRPEELDLWQQVARGTAPLHPGRKAVQDRAPETVPLAPVPPREPPAEAPIPPFRVGEAARTATRHDLAAPLSDRLAAAPLKMDAKAFARMSRGRLAPEARIDLHGMTLAEAQPELARFILNAHAAGLRLVLVITGKGRRGRDDDPMPQRMGALKQQVPVWLQMAPLGPAVLQVAEAHLRHGGAGAYYVYLRRPR
jgi:DNA-nicking Smr family endonuclease